MALRTSVSPAALESIRRPLRRANLAFNKEHPGERADRQPVHTVYEGAQLFRATVAEDQGRAALESLNAFAPDSATLAQALGMDLALARQVYPRVVEKLRHEPVEDYRIDFEDGYGVHPDAEEDARAVAVAEEVARGFAAGVLPHFLGIRLKTFNEELFARSARTLDLFMTAMLRATRGRLPGRFVVTLPKVTAVAQVTALVRILEVLERRFKLEKGALRLELMVEMPQSLIGSDGRVVLPDLVRAAGGRCDGAHFGTYDYTTGCNITAAYQSMAHLACDFARHVMQVSLAGTGIPLSDGSTNVMPIPPHRGGQLGPKEQAENRAAVHRAWRLSYGHIRHSLENAFYQGWDLHPAQLPIRYAAVYAFFLEGLPAASVRMEAFVRRAAEATLVGDVFDDAATGQALLNFFLKGLGCGALREEDVLATGLTREELATRSFLAILARRKAPAEEVSPRRRATRR